MWSKIFTYIKKYNLLNANELYLVALSGGADSVALLLLLKEAGYKIHVAHCNFRLRGDESDRDEAFCVDLCRGLGVELHRAHFDTREYAELHKVSIEMAARDLRYNWFAQLCKDLGAAGVCVAHHRDDSVETVLLNLVRGAGLRGLTGIKPRSEQVLSCGKASREQLELVVLRPLLCVSRAEIELFLADKGQKYVVDSTNLEADVQRNKVRLQVLPLLQELNPSVMKNIQRTSENLSGAQAVLENVLFDVCNCNKLTLSGYKDCASREYITYEWLRNYGFNGSQIRQILDAETGGMVCSEQGYDVLKDRERLLLEPTLQPFHSMRIPEEGTYVLNKASEKNSENIRLLVKKCAAYVSKKPYLATLDAEKVKFPLTIRRVEEGDWMIPYGMKGRKLLSDLMTDLKMNLFEKRRQLVVVDNQGVVVWLVGLRVDNRVAVAASSKEVVELCYACPVSCPKNH